MRIFCIPFGLLAMSFSAASGDAFNAMRAQSFHPSKPVLLGGSYAHKNDNADTENNAQNDQPEGIAGVDRYVGERARQVVVAKGRYVEVTYREEYGKTEIAEGFVRSMDDAELTIYRGGLRKIIPLDRIDVLMVCDNSN